MIKKWYEYWSLLLKLNPIKNNLGLLFFILNNWIVQLFQKIDFPFGANEEATCFIKST